MSTMNDLHGDGSNHKGCPKCEMCLVCDKCICNPKDREGYIKELFADPDMDTRIK